MPRFIEKMLAEKPHFCLMPFVATTIEPGGLHKPCCKYKKWSTTENAREASLQQIIESSFYKKIRKKFIAGEKPAECERCWIDEDRNNKSMRQSYNRMFRHEFLKPDLKAPVVKIIDYGFGNHCNAGCITCQSSSSTTWIKEDKMLEGYKGNYFGRTAYPIIKDKFDHWTPEDYAKIRRVSHAQTEALLSPELEPTLDRFIKYGDPSQMLYDISTNGSYFPEESVIEKLGQFRKIEIQFSLDGVGGRNDYIRYPLKWSKIEKTVDSWLEAAERHKGFEFKVRCTLSALNALYAQEIIDWWKAKSNYENNERIEGVQFGHAWGPDYLSTMILPRSVKSLALDRCDDEFLSNLFFEPSQGTSLAKETRRKHELSRFFEFIKLMDAHRKTNAQETFPELFKALEDAGELMWPKT